MYKKEPQKEATLAEGDQSCNSLERVLGLTSANSNSICVNPKNGDVCYLAGCFVVVYSPKENKQVQHLQSKSAQPFKSVCFSQCGEYLAAGESAFKKAEINIWRVTYQSTLQQTLR